MIEDQRLIYQNDDEKDSDNISHVILILPVDRGYDYQD